MESDLRKPQNPDWEERATETEGDEVLETLDSSTLEEVKQIEAALKRVDAGTYGVCLRCGQSVGDERLEAVPHAATCQLRIRIGLRGIVGPRSPQVGTPTLSCRD